ncbi:hypothetical protein ATL39_0839 [Sinobaca qinghaiensis]|uniref:Uncharacterized protein n=1 Tax=Sinobaca qinghaiensis TaxID=342944 RepID=A0A419V580_9BACL|nr:hypothetical protein [Sinobaca qinghaiensis]RKD75143.1 hypothetical protein ATL39_0839 [Sinobaca qinghaiensis]
MSFYVYAIVISFLISGVVFFIKNASNMSKTYFLLTLIAGILSLGFILIGFIIPGLGGFTGIFLSQIALILYVIFFLMSILYPTSEKDSE